MLLRLRFFPGSRRIRVHCHSLNLGCHWLCQCSSLLTDQGKNSKDHWQSQWHTIQESSVDKNTKPSCAARSPVAALRYRVAANGKGLAKNSSSGDRRSSAG